MSQTYHISKCPTAYITETTCLTTVLRGTTRFRIKVELAQVKGTSFGTKLLQQLEIWKGLPWGKARNEPISDLIYHHCLPLLERLAPQTLLQDLSLEAFLHSPTYNLELVRGGSAEDIRIQGADACLYTPAFFTSPMRTADLPSACTAIPRFQARDIRISPTLAAFQPVSAIQGRVETAAGRALYSKPRFSRANQNSSASSAFSRVSTAPAWLRCAVQSPYAARRRGGRRGHDRDADDADYLL
jgi:hypothetical protein